MPRSQVLDELRGLSNTLSEGVPAQGRGRLQAASLMHSQAKERSQMKRQGEMDELMKPGMELERDKAKGAIDRRNIPVTLPSLTGGNLWQMNHWVSKGKGEGDQSPMIKEFANAFGAEFDENKESPTYGKMVRKDGSVVTHGDMDDNPELAQSIVIGNTDYARSARDLIEQIDVDKRASAMMQKHGVAIDAEEMAKKDASRAKAVNFLNNPKLQIEAMENQIQWLSKFRGPGWEKGIARVQNKIDRVHKEYLAKIVASAKALTAAKTEKDNRSNDEKLMDYYAEHITGGDKAKAIEIFRNDKFIEEKLRVYAEELKGMQGSMEWMNMPTEDKAAAIENLQIRLELKPRPGAPTAPMGGRKELLTGQGSPQVPGWKKYDPEGTQ